MYLNKVLLIGNLTRDPEVKALPSGTSVSSFSVATNRVWKDKNGQRKEEAQFHNVVVFGRQAEIVGQYLKRGASVLVEGRLQNRSWDAQDGTKRYRTEIVADRVQFGPKQGGGAPGSFSPSAAQVDTAPVPSEPAAIEYPEEDINPEDIPF
jgi:single-strand DNA-binding protein